MQGSRKCILILSLSLTLVSCSRPRTIYAEELRSDLLAAISLASETELFIHQLQEGRATASFAEGHMAYLGKEARESADELHQKHADNAMAGALENCRAQLVSLAALINNLEDKSRDKKSLSAGAEQAANIRMSLEHIKDEL
jgi:Mg2+ and Co2+ transporter CorA